MGKGGAQAPVNWPSGLPFLCAPSYSPHLSSEQQKALRMRSQDSNIEEIPSRFTRGACPLVKISPITDPNHPAFPQYGLFAARSLGPGSLILPYYGITHTAFPPHSSAHETSDYDLWLDRDVGVAVDASLAGNEARFINDYRGVRERPNAEFRECWDARTGERCMAVFVLPQGKKDSTKKTSTGIPKGEEICVSYGKGFWLKRQDNGEGAPKELG